MKYNYKYVMCPQSVLLICSLMDCKHARYDCLSIYHSLLSALLFFRFTSFHMQSSFSVNSLLLISF